MLCRSAQLAVAQSDQPLPASSLPGMRPLELLDDRYIIAKGPDGVYIIDFHAAHERVMYERLRLQSQYQRVGTQELLEPLSLELSRAEGSALEQLLPELGELGFAIERFGASSFVVRSVDRKSTRLNSSHALISYAVFCLKKKKKIENTIAVLPAHYY